jgi:hypothetical protein
MVCLVCDAGLLKTNRRSVKMQKCHKNNIQKLKFENAESVLSEINPVRVGFCPGKYRIFK